MSHVEVEVIDMSYLAIWVIVIGVAHIMWQPSSVTTYLCADNNDFNCYFNSFKTFQLYHSMHKIVFVTPTSTPSSQWMIPSQPICRFWHPHHYFHTYCNSYCSIIYAWQVIAAHTHWSGSHWHVIMTLWVIMTMTSIGLVHNMYYVVTIDSTSTTFFVLLLPPTAASLVSIDGLC